jgi:hypothetical protein
MRDRTSIVIALMLVVGCHDDGASSTGETASDASVEATADATPSDGSCGDGTCNAGEDWYSCNADCPGSCEGCLFSASYDTAEPCTQFSSCQRQAPGRITAIDAPVRAGSFAGRFEVRSGDMVNSGARAEVVHCLAGSGCVGESEGTERWYGWSTYWPADFDSAPTWQLFTQWHHVGNSGSPPIELYVNGATMYFRTTDNAGTGHVVHWNAPLVTDTWRNFILGIRFSNDGTGWVELWLDGEQVLSRTPTRTMIDNGNIFKQGLYRNANITRTQTLLHDNLRKGSTREQVD